MSVVKRLVTVEEEKQIETIKAIACEVNKEELSTFLQKISTTYKIPKYLKRVKNNIVLVSLETTLNISFLPNTLVVDVPSTQPITREQYDQCKKIWPCNFYPKKIEKLELPNTLILSVFQNIYEINNSKGINEINYSKDLNNILDLTDYKNISFIKNNLQIDNNISEKQFFYQFFYQFFTNVNKKKENILFCCGTACIIDTSNKKVIEISKDTSHILEHAIFKCIEKVSKNKETYLCTGYDAFCVFEPCISCGMALVHARIQRLFSIFPNKHSGIFSVHRLNQNPNINHRFEVYFLKEKYKKNI
ncbi:hypothetical protein CWI38_0114p0050 [Hamiltosporidium tvaerminnensis]|uniref:Uncharacterized protein n=2 Tax=Hamiltosporidium tvaerminnensis TaxID=1176355 RepID=A0A4Q9M3N1_9MICR|nr:hypothetical protein CWI38_0114p0050 [Hamiltosporidium tvaerminnensis]